MFKTPVALTKPWIFWFASVSMVQLSAYSLNPPHMTLQSHDSSSLSQPWQESQCPLYTCTFPLVFTSTQSISSVCFGWFWTLFNRFPHNFYEKYRVCIASLVSLPLSIAFYNCEDIYPNTIKILIWYSLYHFMFYVMPWHYDQETLNCPAYKYLWCRSQTV